MTRLLLFLLALGQGVSAVAQPARVYRIGVLEISAASANRANMNAFLLGLREAGYVEGKNLVIDYRSADGRPERFRELAADLVRAKSDVILTRTTPAALAAKAAGSIPIVMTTSADPVGSGVVPSLAKPGGLVTGLATMQVELAGKRVEIVKDLVPPNGRIGALTNMSNPNGPLQWKQIERATRTLGLQAVLLDARDAEQVGRVLQSGVQQRIDALVVNVEAAAMGSLRTIIAFAAKHKLPVMYSSPEFVEAGGLMSYGVHYPDLYYRAATYVDKILKGAKPGDLPIEQATKLNLVINLKTARDTGIEIPRELLMRADQLIR
jgi:putative ABC transport system substrate-binding protein